jgi:hypothetical protein
VVINLVISKLKVQVLLKKLFFKLSAITVIEVRLSDLASIYAG